MTNICNTSSTESVLSYSEYMTNFTTLSSDLWIPTSKTITITNGLIYTFVLSILSALGLISAFISMFISNYFLSTKFSIFLFLLFGGLLAEVLYARKLK